MVGGGVTDRARAQQEDIAELKVEVERESAGKSGVDRVASRLRAGDRYRQRLLAEDEASRAVDESELGQMSWVSVHPSLPSRLKRLQAMGAQVDEAVFASQRTSPTDWVFMLAMSPFIALIVLLLGVTVVLSSGLVIVSMMIPMGIVYLVFELLF